MAEILKKIIKYCVFVSLFTPLIINGNFMFPYVFPKTALFQVLVEIALAGLILLMALEPRYRPQWDFLTKTISLWLIVLFFTALVGVNFYHSLWSSYERMTGLVTMLHYFAFFLILVSVFRAEKDWLNLFDISIVASLIVGLYGLAQKIGLSGFINPTAPRISATFGNPSFLAAYLLFNIFLILFLFYKKYSLNLGWRFYYLSILLFELIILAWTITRGAVLGLFVGTLIFLFLFLITRSRYLPEINPFALTRVKKIVLAGLIILIVLSGFIYVNRASDWLMNKFPLLSGLTSISFETATAKTRLMAWGMSWQGWKERFLFGWGWENYHVVFNKFYNPYLFPVETWFDRAHNIFFDTVVSSGLIGLLSYLAVFGACFWILWKNFFKQKINFFTANLFFVLLIVYFLQNFFVFDMLHSYLMLFLILGFIGFISRVGNEPIEERPAEKRVILQRPSSFVYVSVLTGLILSLYFINFKPAMAGYYSIEALKHKAATEQAGFYKQDKVLGAFENSFKYGSFGRWEVSMRLGEHIMDLVSVKDKVFEDDFQRAFDFALEEMERTIKYNPLDARYQLVLATLYIYASQIEPEKIIVAEQALERVLALSPTKQDILFLLSQVKMYQNKGEEALSLLEKAVTLNPQAGQSRWTLGLYYILNGRKEEGQAEIEQAQALGYHLTWPRIQKLIAFYSHIEAYEEIIPLYEEAIKANPANAQLHASLAATYAQVGDKEKARQEVEEAIRLDPNFREQGEAFLKNL